MAREPQQVHLALLLEVGARAPGFCSLLWHYLPMPRELCAFVFKVAIGLWLKNILLESCLNHLQGEETKLKTLFANFVK